MQPMLLGLGAFGQPTIEDAIDTFLLTHTRPMQTDVIDFLRTFAPGETRDTVARALVARGLPPQLVGNSMTFLNTTSTIFTKRNVIGFLSLVSAALSGYHGYRRNQSIGWAIVWFGAGSLFPVFTPVIAVAQGFGKRKAA